MAASLETVTGYDGQPTRVLKMHSKLTNPNPASCCQQIGLINATMDTSNPASRDYYMRARWRLDPSLADYAASKGTSFWWAVAGFKTPTNLRYQLQMVNRQAGGPHWRIQADGHGAACPSQGTTCDTTYWGQDLTAKVPLDQWFTIEWYRKVRNDKTGVVRLAVNGQLIFERLGENDGVSSENPTNNAHAIVYVTGKPPMYMLVDDVEVRGAPPCAGFPCGN
jgi:hypothetical protein